MSEVEKAAYVHELTEAVHTLYEDMESVLRDLMKSIERVIDHHTNADLVKIEAE